MKAVVYKKYGSPDVLQLTELEKPTPQDNEILVKIVATSVTPMDDRMRGFRVPVAFWLPARLTLGFFGPKQPILGTELSGEVEAVGKEVKSYKVGDAVFGSTAKGTYVEYVTVPEEGMRALKPATLSFEEAAAVTFGPFTALRFLRDKGKIQRGQKVLINGASGGVGTFAVQLAKYYGAHVTGVCSTANIALVKSLGADQVIDYTQQDFTKSGQTYDIILDAVGKSSYGRCKKALSPDGVYLNTVPSLGLMLRMLWTARFGRKKAIFTLASPSKEDFLFLTGLFEQGKLKTVIDRCYPLEQIAEAHRYVGKGHKKGNVIISIGRAPHYS